MYILLILIILYSSVYSFLFYHYVQTELTLALPAVYEVGGPSHHPLLCGPVSYRKVQKWGQIVRREKKPDGLENSREWFYMPTLHCLTWGKEYIKHKVPHRLEF